MLCLFFNYLCIVQNRHSKRTRNESGSYFYILLFGSVTTLRINFAVKRHLGSFILPETKCAMCTRCAAFLVNNSQQEKKITYSLLLFLWWDKDFSSSLHRLLSGLEPSSSFWKCKSKNYKSEKFTGVCRRMISEQKMSTLYKPACFQRF